MNRSRDVTKMTAGRASLIGLLDRYLLGLLDPFVTLQVTRLRAKNQITLPASVVAAVGLREGDVLRVAAEQGRVIITAQERRDRGRTYTMSDLLGAASGLYRSVDDIDAGIAAGRAE